MRQLIGLIQRYTFFLLHVFKQIGSVGKSKDDEEIIKGKRHSTCEVLVSRSLPPIPNPFLISRPPPAPVRPTNHPTLLINSFLCPKTHLKLKTYVILILKKCTFFPLFRTIIHPDYNKKKKSKTLYLWTGLKEVCST